MQTDSALIQILRALLSVGSFLVGALMIFYDYPLHYGAGMIFVSILLVREVKKGNISMIELANLERKGKIAREEED